MNVDLLQRGKRTHSDSPKIEKKKINFKYESQLHELTKNFENLNMYDDETFDIFMENYTTLSIRLLIWVKNVKVDNNLEDS